jgi:hypothetical protein
VGFAVSYLGSSSLACPLASSFGASKTPHEEFPTLVWMSLPLEEVVKMCQSVFEMCPGLSMACLPEEYSVAGLEAFGGLEAGSRLLNDLKGPGLHR